MRAVLLFFAVVATSSLANAQGRGCSAVLNNINEGAALIEQSATTYWTHRAKFVDLIYGPSSQVVPNAVQVAEHEKSAADVEKQAMPGRVNSLKGLLTAFNAQGCDPSLLLVTFEPAIKHGKRVNFDQFPPESELEEQAGPGPTRMPR
ncbi:hypothetical protein P8936_09470 [Edaphobacter paludis]|uniref:Uncharacterized protein n=1 Tax=Edaphobacter paludis TaxID=3035702 RepID=A0AAU7D2E0_9BACT